MYLIRSSRLEASVDEEIIVTEISRMVVWRGQNMVAQNSLELGIDTVVGVVGKLSGSVVSIMEGVIYIALPMNVTQLHLIKLPMIIILNLM